MVRIGGMSRHFLALLGTPMLKYGAPMVPDGICSSQKLVDHKKRDHAGFFDGKIKLCHNSQKLIKTTNHPKRKSIFSKRALKQIQFWPNLIPDRLSEPHQRVYDDDHRPLGWRHIRGAVVRVSQLKNFLIKLDSNQHLGWSVLSNVLKNSVNLSLMRLKTWCL